MGNQEELYLFSYVSFARQSINFIGLFDFSTIKICYNFHHQSFKHSTVIKLFYCIVQQGQRMPITIVVLDNVKIHRHIDIEKLDELLIDHRLIFIYLLPLNPELNPIKIIWKLANYHWRRCTYYYKDELFDETQNSWSQSTKIIN